MIRAPTFILYGMGMDEFWVMAMIGGLKPALPIGDDGIGALPNPESLSPKDMDSSLYDHGKERWIDSIQVFYVCRSYFNMKNSHMPFTGGVPVLLGRSRLS